MQGPSGSGQGPLKRVRFDQQTRYKIPKRKYYQKEEEEDDRVYEQRPRDAGGRKDESRRGGKTGGVTNKPGNTNNQGPNNNIGGGQRGNRDTKRGRSEYISPVTFSQAWLVFFSTIALGLVKDVGLDTASLHTLNTLAIGGRLMRCVKPWKLLTNNSWVTNVVRSGYKIPLKSKPHQSRPPTNPSVCDDAHQILDIEAKGLLAKGAVSIVQPVPDQYQSCYFAVPKPRSVKWRPILNLKYFNDHVRHYKFRMESFKLVREWLQPNAFLVGLDLTDQFLSVPMNKRFRKYLRFTWLHQLYEWKVLPFGLKCSPRVVTKLLKPVMAFLRENWGILISIYMDDMILQAPTAEKAYLHAQITILVLLYLGWEINWEKSNLTPSHKLTHLGFDIDTSTMTASCPTVKVERLRDHA